MKEFTVFIPTYNRPKYLGRLLSYYNECKEKNSFEIIIADSSSPENKIKNKKIISLFLNSKISYIDSYPETTRPWVKFLDAVSRIKTEYCLLCSDDDFVIPMAARLAVDFLDANSDFSVAQGVHINVYPGDKNNGEKEIYWKVNFKPESNLEENADKRINKHLANYKISTFSGVHRTSLFKFILQEAVKFTDDERFGELITSVLALIYGKMKVFDYPYAVLHKRCNSTGATTPSISDFLRECNYEKKYANFRDCLSFHLSKESGLSRESSKLVIQEAMNKYLKDNYPRTAQYFFLNKIKDVLNYLPKNLRLTIKDFYRRFHLNMAKPNKNQFNFTNDLNSEYRDDFALIGRLLKQYP
jgi:glycosyltransferase domain-containing protein